jgi:hypothetical protein
MIIYIKSGRSRQWDGGLEIGIYGQYEALMTELVGENAASYKKFTRIGPEMSRG